MYAYAITLSYYLQLVIFTHIRNFPRFHHGIVALCMIYIYECVYMCSLYLYILLCNRVPWKNSLTEWYTLYEYIWNKKVTVMEIVDNITVTS